MILSNWIRDINIDDLETSHKITTALFVLQQYQSESASPLPLDVQKSLYVDLQLSSIVLLNVLFISDTLRSVLPPYHMEKFLLSPYERLGDTFIGSPSVAFLEIVHIPAGFLNAI